MLKNEKVIENDTLDDYKCTDYVEYQPGELKKVKIDPHEKDHGHYEPHLVGYYCGCGAMKPIE